MSRPAQRITRIVLAILLGATVAEVHSVWASECGWDGTGWWVADILQISKNDVEDSTGGLGEWENVVWIHSPDHPGDDITLRFAPQLETGSDLILRKIEP